MEQSLQRARAGSNLAIWATQVQACRNSGLTVKAWCEENGITPNTYFRRQRKVYEAMQQQEAFYEVPHQPTAKGIIASIQINGITVDVLSGADEQTLGSILRAVQAC